MPLEQVALAWARAARVSLDERLLAAWRNAANAGVMHSNSPVKIVPVPSDGCKPLSTRIKEIFPFCLKSRGTSL